MQEYRKKMEEQKRLREKILREKENRRKMAAMEKQNEETKIDASAAGKLICCPTARCRLLRFSFRLQRYNRNVLVSENTQQEIKPASAVGIVKDGIKTRPGVAKGRGRPTNIQSTEVQH